MNLSHSITVARRAWNAMLRHAATDPQRECCGALLADAGGRVVDIVVARNEADAPAREYRIGPDAVRRIEAGASRAGLGVTGFFHSHPAGSLRPSRRDLEAALPGYVYLIVRAQDEGDARRLQPQSDSVAAWRLRHDRGGFDRVTLVPEVA